MRVNSVAEGQENQRSQFAGHERLDIGYGEPVVLESRQDGGVAILRVRLPL